MKSIFLKLSTFVLLFALMGAGCKKEDTPVVCGVKDPLEKLDWLRDIKNGLKDDVEVIDSEIILYQLSGSDYIYVQKTISSSHDIPNTIFDCSGNVLFNCGGNQPSDNCSTFFKNAKKITVLWKK